MWQKLSLSARVFTYHIPYYSIIVVYHSLSYILYTRSRVKKLKYYGARKKLREAAEELIYEKVGKGVRELGL